MTLLPITGNLVHALGWAILHAIWQAFFVYACLRVVLKLWPMASARIKYNLSVVSLAGIFTWFLITLYQQLAAVSATQKLLVQYTGTDMAAGAIQAAAPYPSQTQMVWLFPNLEFCFPALVSLYIAGMLLMAVKFVSDLVQLQQIRTTQVESMGTAWEKHLEHLAAQLALPRKVKLLVSRYVHVPVMLGFLKPVILVPIAMVNNLTEAQLEAILLHELAHVKRNDYLLNIFQSIVETILFFNPFVWLISRIIRQEREHCCDDLVIASTAQPMHYAQALVALEQYRLTANPLSMAAADNKQHLFYRIKRIMEMKTKHLNYSQKFLAVLIIATGLISIAWLNPVTGKNNRTADKSLMAADTILPATVPVAQRTSMPAVPPAPPTPAPAETPEAPATPDTPEAAPLPDAMPLPPAPPEIPDAPEVPFNGTLYDRESKIWVYQPDSVPQMRKYTGDASKIRAQVREAQKSVQQAMKQLQEVDLKRIQAEAKAATENVDWKAIAAETQKAQQHAAEALKNINWDQINKDIQQAYQTSFKDSERWKEVNKNVERVWKENRVIVEKSMKEARQHMAAFNKDRIKAMEDSHRDMADRMEKRQKSFEESSSRSEKARQRADEARDKAEEARAKAEENRQEHRSIIKRFADDKLIDPSKSFLIEKNNSGLYIDGKKVADDVAARYKDVLKNKNITIHQKRQGNLSISVED
ncbi:M56 family metallopeptidase [Chitinophaga solisilvae]|uniref:M56 family metallopeptidase n=1 Tax=Chitinophaga solisilvae TaxID=1233460 RepID=UPI00136C839C|nr:M56 family metallopeptidase [Chitinophaga solisilvae]